MSGSPGSIVVIEVRADEVASEIVVGNGPDSKEPNFERSAVGPLPLIIWCSTNLQ